MSTNDAVYYPYTNVTATGILNTGLTKLGGVFCASSSAGTLKIWDNTAGSGAVLVNTFSLVAGTWYPLPFIAKTGVFLTVGGTADFTIAWM